MLRAQGRVALFAAAALVLCSALGARAEPAMFRASFIFHAWGNDTTSGRGWEYTTNDWTAAPLGYDCQHASQYTMNGAPSSRWCSKAKRNAGHPVRGTWTRSSGTGEPARLVLQQSDFGIQLAATGTPGVGSCCRGFRRTWPPYIQSFTYATFVNAAGSFFAGGGAAASLGYNNKFPEQTQTGTWLIRAGENAFGGAMGLLGRLGGMGLFSVSPSGGVTYHRTSSWNIVKAIGRPLFGTVIGSTASGAPRYRNPYVKTNTWHFTPTMGPIRYATCTAIGSGTLWTTGQVGNLAREGEHHTSLWRTGYDNRTAGGMGTLQLVSPTLTHRSRSIERPLRGNRNHSAQIGILTIRVPEPGAWLLLAAGLTTLGLLYRLGRRG